MQGPFEQGEKLISAAKAESKRVLQLDVMIVMEASWDSQLLLQSMISGHRQLADRIASELVKRTVRPDQYDLSINLCFYKDIFMDRDAVQICHISESEKIQQYAGALSDNTAHMLSGLEALYCAMCSRFRKKKPFCQQYIFIFALSPVYPLENPMNTIDPEYPALLGQCVLPNSPDIPKSLGALRKIWHYPGETELDPFHSYLLVTAAPSEIWMEIGQWNRADYHLADDIQKICQAWETMPGELAERIAVDLESRLDR